MYIQANDKGIKITPSEKSWRLVHNGTKVIALHETVGIGRINNTFELFVATTEEECQAEITSLKLIKLVEIKEEKV